MSRWPTGRSHVIAPLVGLAALIVLLGGGCDSSPRAGSGKEQAAALVTLVHQGQGPELLQLPHGGISGMTLTTVQATELPGLLETTGQITFDDRRVANIISRVTGRIEEVRVSQWDTVRRGQPILTLYSPDFMTAEAEYLQAKASVPALSSGGGDSVQFARSMVEAAERKLELLGIGRDQIATIKTAATTFVMRAPISGTVVQNQALRGSAVNPGDVLYGVGTLDDVWITGDIYEDDLARVRVGEPLEAVTTAYPDDVFHGTVERISPGVDPNTHTLQIRCQVINPGLKLKPQMLAQVKIAVLRGTTVIVPLDALVFETDSYFAFVDVGADRFERRKVGIGSWTQPGYARVITGLTPGDQVVTDGTMQVDQLWHEAHGESS
jgi:membrane fusion protein, copper/silver efflux system